MCATGQGSVQARLTPIEERQTLEIAYKEIAKKKVGWPSQMCSMWPIDVISYGMEKASDLSKLWRQVEELHKAMIMWLKGRNLMIFEWILLSFIS